jgi:hypothetical protein
VVDLLLPPSVRCGWGTWFRQAQPAYPTLQILDDAVTEENASLIEQVVASYPMSAIISEG